MAGRRHGSAGAVQRDVSIWLLLQEPSLRICSHRQGTWVARPCGHAKGAGWPLIGRPLVEARVVSSRGRLYGDCFRACKLVDLGALCHLSAREIRTQCLQRDVGVVIDQRGNDGD